MKTQIFKDYAAFEAREDKSVNGVSPEFAEQNHDFEADNATNKGCWNCLCCRVCKYCVECVSCIECDGCFSCFGCVHTQYSRACDDCLRCVKCRFCKNCIRCVGQSHCDYIFNVKISDTITTPMHPAIAAVISEIIAEVSLAVGQYPEWPTDRIHQAAILAEEAGEVVKATLQEYYESGSDEDVRTEIIQTAAMCLRMLVPTLKITGEGLDIE